MQIYIKKEWTHVKYESMPIKVPFKNYGIPLIGFCEKWAISSIEKNIKKVTQIDMPN